MLWYVGLKRGYLNNLERFFNHRWLTVGFFGALIAFTAVYAVPHIGREFMPELEEGNLWIRGTFPLNTSLDNVGRDCKVARSIMGSYPEVDTVVSELGRPDDGTDPTGFYNAEFFVPLRPSKDWPAAVEHEGWRQTDLRSATGAHQGRTHQPDERRPEPRCARRVDWNFSQNIRDNVMEALSGVKGDNSIKIFGPDLKKLDELAIKVRNRLKEVPGIQQRRHLSHQRPDELGVLHRLRQVQKVRRQRRRRQQCTSVGHRRESVLVDDRRRKDL
jgi:cobalt-zinc-cadmium resistance protein CzcA